RPRISFNYKEIKYDLPITDPVIPLEFSSIPTRTLRNAYITIGIGEPLNNQHYLFAVMLREIN
ncbi:MAG: dual OB domain-containing protein, partial [Promethearchaeota archaeon]